MNWYFLHNDNNWIAEGAWSDTDGGAPVSGFPNANTEDIFLTANSGDVMVDDVNHSIRNFDCTGYTGTITTNNVYLGPYGNVILSPQMKWVVIIGAQGYAGMRINSSATGQTVKTNGFVIPYLQYQFATGGNGVFTLLDTLNCETLQPVGSSLGQLAFAGSFGWVTKRLKSQFSTAVLVTTVLPPGNVYKVTDLFENITAPGTFHGSFISAVPGTKATLIVTGNAQVAYTDFTDIDASGGRPIYTFGGVVTNCINIVSFVEPVVPLDTTVAASFII